MIERVARHADQIITAVNDQFKNDKGEVEPLLMLVGQVRTLYKLREHLKDFAVLKEVQLPRPLAGDEADYPCERCFKRWFASKVDQGFAYAGAIFCAAVLFVGVYTHLWPDRDILPTSNTMAAIVLILLFASMATPARFTLLGTKVRRETLKLVANVEKNLGDVTFQIVQLQTKANPGGNGNNGSNGGSGPTPGPIGPVQPTTTNLPVSMPGPTQNP